VAATGRERVERFQFQGDRALVKQQAAEQALAMVLESLSV